MTTVNQQVAEAQFAPTPEKRLTQHQRIVKWLNRFGHINQPAAAYSHPCITFKLATRIGEMEEKSGVTFKREKHHTGCLDYHVTPEQLAQLNEVFFKEGNA